MKEVQSDQTMLLIGVGNSGRGDDGLGWKFAEEMEHCAAGIFDVVYRYQLQIEDAELVSGYDVVVFADATYDDLEEGFELKECVPADLSHFSTHAIDPESVLRLTGELYDRHPEAWILAISGKEWGLRTTLSHSAQDHLNGAANFFKGILSLTPVT